jgi:hypothetical protein
MEYGASAEDIARVCHAHPVSRRDVLIRDEIGEGGQAYVHGRDGSWG